MKKSYRINQKQLEIIIDDYNIPFENCFYKNITISFNDNSSKKKKENIITVYYNQKNFYSSTEDINIGNSSEFIFFKNFPTININNKYDIDINEKFEENQIFKRINILNVKRENIKLNGNPLTYYDTFDLSNEKKYTILEEELFPDILFLIGENLQILSFFNKDLSFELSFIKDNSKKILINFFENIELIDKNVSLENLEKNKKKILQMIKDCSTPVNIDKFSRYMIGNIQNFNKYDKDLLIKYGKYQIFKQIFYHDYNLELNEINYNKYIKIFESLNKFYEKCKNIEKYSLKPAKLYYAASCVVLDYINKTKENGETNEELIFDLIEFDKNSIYKDSNDNNLDLILNLTKKSFLYPYFLQFNSSFNKSQILIFDNKFVVTCKTSMITLNQIKLDLIQSLPKYGIRISFDTDYFANTILNSDITIYNEKKLFGYFLSEKELDSNNDTNYIKRVQISFLQKHERFSHYKKYLNKSEKNFINSPRGIINYEENKVFVLASKNDSEKGELGESLEFLLTNGDRALIDNIFMLKKENINLKELYEINSFLERNNNNLIRKLREIQNLTGNKSTEKTNNNENFSTDFNLNSIEKKKRHYENEKNTKKGIENNKEFEFEKRKNEMMSADPIRKYTFERNTIQEYKIINGKLVPYYNENNSK